VQHAANLLLFLLLADASIAQEVERAHGHLKGAEGARLFFETVGEAPDTLVFVHGTPSTMYSLAHDFDRLADQFTLVFFDQRGGGRSESVLEPKALSWQLHV
jgi:pimeloyl-ACP methyl ester carboxylesterase